MWKCGWCGRSRGGTGLKWIRCWFTLMRLLPFAVQDPNNTVVVFSGSETSKLEEIFAPLPIWLAAENGVYVRPPSMRGQTGRGTVRTAEGGRGGAAA